MTDKTDFVAPRPHNGDFIRGADVSSLLAVLRSGARFRDWDGETLGESVPENGAGFMRLLADAGANWVRLRVWNDPYDESGRAYGGGNNDLEVAITVGRWASDAGLRVLIDFHYSDFWADPGRQLCPKAWRGMDPAEKARALYDFTSESLDRFLEAGVDVGMVQVGNETSNALAGESRWEDITRLLSAGCRAVRDTGTRRCHPMLRAVHFESPQDRKYPRYAETLRNGGVEYEVFASSYYPEWHGTLENLTDQLRSVAEGFGVLVMVAETNSPWTDIDADGEGSEPVQTGYPADVEGQMREFEDVARAVRAVGKAGVGLFYWENAWIPAVDLTGLTGAALQSARRKAARLWETHGTGWTTRFAASYDPHSASARHYGPGMSGKAMFDFSGRPLESLRVFGKV